MKKVFQILLNIFLLGVLIFVFRTPLWNSWLQIQKTYFPCQSPITYSIGTFDTKFGLSKTDFLSALKEAEAVWEKPIGKNLFEYSATGDLKVNLIYDNRQAATIKLQGMGIVVKNSRSSYDELKSKFDSVNADYQAQKSAFNARVSSFNSRSQRYDAEVSSLNRSGGANRATVNRLNQERDYLNAEAVAIKQDQIALNNSVDNVNALVSSLNDLAKSLNIDVKNYNSVGDSLGGEFDEGLYKSSGAGQEIDIYQFENHAKLVRVLAHELGHALGLEHNEDPKAIMYRLNNGVNEKVTATDLVEIKTLCKIK